MTTVYVSGPDGYVSTKPTGKGQRFYVTIPNNYFVWGVYPLVRVIEVDRAVSIALGKEVRYITGLTITQRMTLWDGFRQAFTLNLYVPRTVYIGGEYHEGPAPPYPEPPAKKLRPAPKPAKSPKTKPNKPPPASDPKMQREHRKTGIEHHKAKRHAEAVKSFSSAIHAGADDAHIYFLRGQSRAALRTYVSAIADYFRAITRDPTRPEYYASRADAYAALKSYIPSNRDRAMAKRLR